MRDEFVDTSDRARGHWAGILKDLGLPDHFLKNQHGPCPMCGGKDRYRFDNKGGDGTYFCSQCGAGNGMTLAMNFTGMGFKQVADRIDELLGFKGYPKDRKRPEVDTKALLREVARSTVRVAKGDLVDRYLTARGVEQVVYPRSIRFAQALRDGDGGIRPCMVATVTDADGQNVTLHRTFLRADGGAKAEMPSPRKLMPGSIPDGSSVRLSDFAGGALGIAEGIETALSASRLFEMPVWAAINANLLSKWMPPEGCDEVAIFADNDDSATGQAAAFALAKRIKAKGICATVHIPEVEGQDWNDVLLAKIAGGTI